MDFISRLHIDLTIIANRSNLADLDKVEEMAKNMKSISLINKNIIVLTNIPIIAKVKKLKAQILKL